MKLHFPKKYVPRILLGAWKGGGRVCVCGRERMKSGMCLNVDDNFKNE
jgi:hypothetical protein